jgi:hypothetical protein
LGLRCARQGSAVALSRAPHADNLSLCGFRFFFYSNEGDPREPMHVHVMKAGCEAKFWMRPAVVVAANGGFDVPTLRLLATVIEDRRALIERAWGEHFG